ncbi:MAG TPA: hypothetical protein VIN10_09755 [Bacteroidales bacterium]
MKTSAIFNKILAVTFLLIIFVAMTLFFVLKTEDVNLEENRNLAVLPEFDVNKLDPFPQQYDKYYADHFPFRSEIVKAFNKINFIGLKISPLPEKVIIGLNDFLFMSGEEMETYQGKNLFTKEELQSILEELTYRRDFCASEGAKFYFVIIPQKQTIYEEYIPLKYRTTKKETNRVKLEEYLRQNNFPVYDPTNYFFEKKNDGKLLYLNTDNHWNNLGAFYASQYITDVIRKDFPQIAPLTLDNYTFVKKEREGGNLAQMLNMKDELLDYNFIFERNDSTKAMEGKKVPYTPPPTFPYPWEYERVYVNPEANDLKAVIICESFGTLQLDFYKESFGKTVLIFDEWQHALNPEIIKNEKPDIVVIQVLENMLNRLLMHQAKNEKPGA